MKTLYMLVAFLIVPTISNSQGAYEKYGLSYDREGHLMEGKYIINSEEGQTVKVYQYNKGLLHGEFMIYTSGGNIIERETILMDKSMENGLPGLKMELKQVKSGLITGKEMVNGRSGMRMES